jgi:hypothetical protein
MTTYHAEADILTPAAPDPDVCIKVEGLLPGRYAPAVGQSLHDTNGISASLAVDAEDSRSAETYALGLIMSALAQAGIDALEILNMRVVRWDLFEAETEAPNYPDLVGATEAATILGVSRQRVHQLLRENPGFPEPLYHLRSTGPLWVRQGIESFARHWERRPGRPPKVTGTGRASARGRAVAGAEKKKQGKPPVLKTWVNEFTPRGERIPLRHVAQRMIHPGLEPLQGEGFVGAQPDRQLDLPGNWPHSSAILHWFERAEEGVDRDAFGAEEQDSAVGALFTLVADRRCQVVPEVMATVEGSSRQIAIPISGLVDPALGSPMPSWDELNQDLGITLARIASLGDDDARTISDAMHMHYCAALLATSDLTGAYALVVGGLEALAQQYGSPPGDWAEWDLAVSWDGFMAEQQLTKGQSAALRDQLMLDKQIRLAETFATYVSNRLPAAFWREPVREYKWNVNGLTGKPLGGLWEAGPPRAGVFTGDRRELKKALKRSYYARSRFIHAGERAVPFSDDLVSRIPGHEDDRLSFAALRAALRRLILTELESRASSDRLPPLEWRSGRPSDDDSAGGSPTVSR